MDFRKNSKVTLTITDIGVSGEGIGKMDGYTFFVKDAIPGDEVSALITKPKKNYAYARCEKVLTPSPFRMEPVCSCYRPCGGCQLQAMSYEKQLEMKQQKVKNNLMRIGGFEETFIESIMEPIAGMENPLNYRNKAQYPVGTDKEGKPVAGFYAGRTHSIIPNTDCKLGANTDGVILREVLSFMEDNHIAPYREEEGKGLVRHILIRTGFTTGEIMVCIVINGKELPHGNKLVDRLLTIPETKGRIQSISTSSNMENTNVIMGKEITIIYGKPYITDYIGDVAFRISPLSFFQVNPVQTKVLYETALSYANLEGNETVWDLYCGIGTISLFLARKAGQVYGVEIVEQAIEDARQNAVLNHMENVEFFVGKAEEVLPEKYEKEQIYADVIVVDPPRKGCDEACLSTMLKMKPERIVYVSCDSATLARDLRILCEGGYELKKVRPVDMFPMTVHVEVACCLQRKDS